MAVDAIVKDGVIVNNGQAASEKKDSTTTTKLGEYKEQFMQLLCAQMKYQDPLEPTSNTEYISQYAQFTQVEQMQNLSNTVALNRAADMVGKTVQITQVDEETGETKSIVEGKVDFVTYESGTSYVSVNGNKYKLDDVTAVVDGTYFDNTQLAESVRKDLDKLPGVDYVTLYADKDRLERMLANYETMTAMTGDVSQFFSTAELSKISQYALKYADLIDQAAKETENTHTSQPVESLNNEDKEDT
ncbi:flagellar basal-body rod modification protein FlgD [Butyrivibrio fibrisolvens]|jgi:flagellar basal-body rod modification protein FlgD|uniref:Basal-body rod modification protein FlgD n=1 Tax=Butyrivibrio fibrisolvens TaxID=831 RepID=A0A1H9NE39_BUTFI|nr:flagellar hook capping FlgD N-terminal domain-containing protein [Butyrivibrio fibrisolvens]SER34246.1 flagellar basal-body rod modification protein FlgD [Butyrivibrio fibrisolvens]